MTYSILRVFNLGGPDLAIILMIVVLLFAAKKLPGLFRWDRPPEAMFSELTKVLLLVGAAIWAIIIVEHL